MSDLIIGLPSKGRLRDDTMAWFADRGVEIQRDGSEREYAASVAGLDGVSVAMLSAGEMPRELASGRIHIGVTGEDLIRERMADHERIVRMPAAMGFGHADLVVAVPAVWADVRTMHDLDEAAHAFLERHRQPMRIATKYHALTRAFFAEHGVADYRLVDSQGATEAGPKNLTCEAIVDITSSGETLRANHLRTLDDGLILASQAMLCVSQTADWPAATRASFAALAGRMGLASDDPQA